MKAIVIHEPGGPEKLIYEEVPTPEVKEGWSLVRVQGFGINHSEIFTRKGQSPSVKFPRILGIECVGVVEETTDEERLPAGTQVISIMGEMGREFDGGYAEYALLPNEQIHPVHTKLPVAEWAALPETYYTAFGSMKNLQIHENDRVLVRGATSGVGIAFLRLLKGKWKNIFVAGTSRSGEKKERLLAEGFDEVVIDADNVLRTEEKYDRVFDLIGPAALRDTFARMKERAVVCCTGLLGGKWALDDFDPLEDLPVNGYVTSFHSGNVDGGRLQEMLDFVEKYRVDVAPEKVFSLTEVPDAHRYLESGGSFGKVVVVNGES